MLEELKKLDIRERWRKAAHMPAVILAPILIWLLGYRGAETFCICALAYILGTGYAEKHLVRLPISHEMFKMASRGNEIEFPIAQTLYLIAVFITALLLPFSLSFAVFGVLAIGDGAAAIFGMLFGKHRISYNRDKTWEGTIAGIVFGFLGALVMGWIGTLFEEINTKSPLFGAPGFGGIWMPMILIAFLTLLLITAWVEIVEHITKLRYDRWAAFFGVLSAVLIGLLVFGGFVIAGIEEPIFAAPVSSFIKFSELPFIYFTGALVGMLAESASGKFDNLIVPLTAAGAMLIAVLVL